MCALRFVARMKRRKLLENSNRHYRSRLRKGIRARMAVCCMLAVARKPSLSLLSSPGNPCLQGLCTRSLYQVSLQGNLLVPGNLSLQGNLRWCLPHYCWSRRTSCAVGLTLRHLPGRHLTKHLVDTNEEVLIVPLSERACGVAHVGREAIHDLGAHIHRLG